MIRLYSADGRIRELSKRADRAKANEALTP